MAIEYTNTKLVAEKMANFYASQAKLELEAKHTRVAIRAKWKKVGEGWTPVSVTKKTFRGNYVASGQLVNSIQPNPQGMTLGITMNKTADYVQNGRKPGKGIPLDSMRNWTKMKRIQPRDLSTGKFKSKATAESMRFMMNRKIKHFGIEPFPFVQMSRTEILPKFNKALTKAMAQDIKNRFKR